MERSTYSIDGYADLLRHAELLRVQGGEDDFLPALEQALEVGRNGEHLEELPLPPPVMSTLCAAALESGVCTEYVEQVIQTHGLFPPGPDAAQWPWRVRIFTLGRFSLVRDGTPVSFHRKSPRKPLEVLQALIALGGREVSIATLMRAVWPEEESTNCRNLFDNTLYRLRKILGHEQAVILRDSKLTLNSQSCWVDAWAFERIAAQVMGASETCAATALRALDLYRGHFLHREQDSAWQIAYRDRLRSRFERALLAHGMRLEAEERWQEAAALYEQALEVDNLAEGFYQHLMECRRVTGEHAEALRVYRRCRDLLAIVLGVQPSAKTEEIRLRLS